ncbi:hypothetical protein OAJ42_01400, partial [Flavobacteriales bacterium]|nr:hypothetical protein [Flavobacteriales bacterium]
NIGGNWLYIDNLRVGNAEENLNHSTDSSLKNDNRIFDLFGREYYHRPNLSSGIYIKNGKLIFVK